MLPKHQTHRVEGTRVYVDRRVKGTEWFDFATEREAQGRVRFVEEALSWLGTPFVDCGDVKGPKGGVDCAMLLTRAAVDSGLVPPFDPRPYPPRWFFHRGEGQRFADFITNNLRASETDAPTFGDINLYWFARAYSHGCVRLNSEEILHAYNVYGFVAITSMNEPLLRAMDVDSGQHVRPVKYYNSWSALG